MDDRLRDANGIVDAEGKFCCIAKGFVANTEGSYKILSRKVKNDEPDVWVTVPLTNSPLWVEGIGILNADGTAVEADAVAVIF